jgi:protein-S-isoprenylcysteine O-methyltransferase Ste14
MTAEELQLRRLAVCASGLIYWAGVLIQARRIRKQIQRSPNLKPRGAREKALWFGWFMVILAWIGQPWLVGVAVTTPGLALFPGLQHPASLVMGLALVALGYAGTLWTYAAMGDTWRIGIDANEKTALVSRGPFKWVRHPIYLLQIVMLAGAVLLLPTGVSFVTLATHYVCVLIKARDEENYLKTVHGAAYRDYLSNTAGLFPRLIRRRSATGEGAPPGIDS